jgi:hypothetical protein
MVGEEFVRAETAKNSIARGPSAGPPHNVIHWSCWHVGRVFPAEQRQELHWLLRTCNARPTKQTRRDHHVCELSPLHTIDAGTRDSFDDASVIRKSTWTLPLLTTSIFAW